jgi:hypothetical protein
MTMMTMSMTMMVCRRDDTKNVQHFFVFYKNENRKKRSGAPKHTCQLPPSSVDNSNVRPSRDATVAIDAQNVTCGVARALKLNGPTITALRSLPA